MSTSAHNAAVGPETRLLSAFRKDTHHRKVCLAGRGESAHLLSVLTVQKTLDQSRGVQVSLIYHGFCRPMLSSGGGWTWTEMTCGQNTYFEEPDRVMCPYVGLQKL